MTRKDYVLIAEAIRAIVKAPDGFKDARAIAYRIAESLEADNPRFDHERFMAACGF